jgi:hypothetical protein
VTRVGTVALRLLQTVPSKLRDTPLGSDGEREVVECYAEPVRAGDFGSNVVVAAAEVLHEGMTGSEDLRRAVTLQASDRPQPGLHPPVVCLDGVCQIPPR